MKAIKDIVAGIVSKTSQVIETKGIAPINFQHGHFLEIINTLEEYNKSRAFSDKKYPMVALLQDFTETNKSDFTETPLVIVIANFSERHLKAEQRYEQNFFPVLYPICEELIKQFNNSPYLLSYNIDYTKTDRLYWGKEGFKGFGNEANRLNDYVDAIELHIKGKFEFTNCETFRTNFKKC